MARHGVDFPTRIIHGGHPGMMEDAHLIDGKILHPTTAAEVLRVVLMTLDGMILQMHRIAPRKRRSTMANGDQQS